MMDKFLDKLQVVINYSAVILMVFGTIVVLLSAALPVGERIENITVLRKGFSKSIANLSKKELIVLNMAMLEASEDEKEKLFRKLDKMNKLRLRTEARKKYSKILKRLSDDEIRNKLRSE